MAMPGQPWAAAREPSRTRASALAEGDSGHSGARRTGMKGTTRSRMSTIFSRLGAGTAGARSPQVSRALLSARHIAHGRSGSNVSLAAAANGLGPRIAGKHPRPRKHLGKVQHRAAGAEPGAKKRNRCKPPGHSRRQSGLLRRPASILAKNSHWPEGIHWPRRARASAKLAPALDISAATRQRGSPTPLQGNPCQAKRHAARQFPSASPPQAPWMRSF